MKKLAYGMTAVIAVLMIATLIFGVRNDAAPEKIFNETVLMPGGTWTEQQTMNGEIVQYEYQIPESEEETKWVLLLRTHWPDFQILAGDNSIYDTAGKRTGFVHLFVVPTGEKLTVRFLNASEKAVSAIEESTVWIGNRSGVYRKILLENLHAGAFVIFAVVFGVAVLFAGFYMRSAWKKQICQGLIGLGLFIIDAGLWVLTDSQFLLLFTQKSGVVELVSFLTFYSFAIPLLAFTKCMLPEKEKLFSVLQGLFGMLIVFYCVNYVTQICSLAVVIVCEHILMATTILSVIYQCFKRLKKNQNRMLFRLLLGYTVFGICSMVAFAFYYFGYTFQYSISYEIAIIGFIFFLADAAGIAIYEQIQENANVAIYAKMAYHDRMTGLGNRAAFIEDSSRDEQFSGMLSYIMIDANNLKKINDSLGHKRGDELLTTIAGCMETGVSFWENAKCYRIGGDEFVIRLRKMTREETEKCIESVREKIAEADRKIDIPISAAIGYAWSDEAVKDTEKLLQSADAAMYENKQKMKRQ